MGRKSWAPSRRGHEHDSRPSGGRGRPPGVLDRVAGRTIAPDEANGRRRLDRGREPRHWARGGAAPRPPRPPRAPRRAGAASAGGVAEDAGGGAASAASRGARSASADHRINSIVSGATVALPNRLACILSAGSSAPSQSAPSLNMRTAMVTPIHAGRLLAITVVGAFGAAQPLDQPLQFLVLDLRAALAHVQGHHPPPIGAEAGAVDALRRGTRCTTASAAPPLGVGEERRDLRRHVRARKRLRGRAEPLGQPVEQDVRSCGRQRHVDPPVLSVS